MKAGAVEFLIKPFSEQAAAELGTSEITIKVHRGHIMQKMGARSLADLVRAAEKLGIFSRTS
jgi:FixJ family two-component response regulator